MATLMRLLATEAIKLRRSTALRMIWLLPLLFIILDYAFFGPARFRQHPPAAADSRWFFLLPLKAVGALWAGFFHPLMLAVMPGLVFRPEHRFSQWKHLNAMPVSPKAVFTCKILVLVPMAAASLGMVVLGLWGEWRYLALAYGQGLVFQFPWKEMGVLMGWLLLGSLPLLAFYAWASEHISNGAVPVLFGLLGLLLNISLSGRELDPSWRRDLIPWVLPYACAQQAIERQEAKQETHLAGLPFRAEIDLSRQAGTEIHYLPSGRKVTTTTTIPRYFLEPPPPTPKWLLAAFSAGAGLSILSLGIMTAKRDRA